MRYMKHASELYSRPV